MDIRQMCHQDIHLPELRLRAVEDERRCGNNDTRTEELRYEKAPIW